MVFIPASKSQVRRLNIQVKGENILCRCQKYGKKYKVDLNVPDELWEKIKPEGKPEGAGLLCGSCIMERIESISDYSAWDLVRVR